MDILIIIQNFKFNSSRNHEFSYISNLEHKVWVLLYVDPIEWIMVVYGLFTYICIIINVFF